MEKISHEIKSVLIFGASRGIGKELALEYGRRGCKIMLASRNTNELKKTTDLINSQGGRCYYTECDSTNQAMVAEATVHFSRTIGKLDLAVYNAGVSMPVWFNDFDVNQLERTFSVNVFGLGYALESCISIFKKQGGGIFAGVGSLADSRGFIGSGVYCASKAAVSHLLEAARVELQSKNIKIITIKPGFVRTAMTAKNTFYMPFLMDADEAAQIIVKGIDLGKANISFPFPTMLFSNIGKLIPTKIYDYFIGKWRKPLLE